MSPTTHPAETTAHYDRHTCPGCGRSIARRSDNLIRLHRTPEGRPCQASGTNLHEDITFVCVKDTHTTAATYLALRTAERESALAALLDISNTEVWLTDFPQLATESAARLRGTTRTTLIIGTAVDGEWTSWYPAVQAPAVPGIPGE